MCVVLTAFAACASERSGESDEAPIVAAAARVRLTTDNSYGGTVVFDRVSAIGQYARPTPDGFLHEEPGNPMIGDNVRRAIEQAVAPATVTWVRNLADAIGTDPANRPPDVEAVLTLAAPEIDGGSAIVVSNLWCGGVCGVGGSHALKRAPDGTWTVTGIVGAQWVA